MSKYFLISAFFAAAVAVAWIAFRESPSHALDGFAMCLKENGVTMYGADWCPHCRNEKKRFGAAFQYVPYVECPDEPELCLELGVRGYPTWIFSDGRRFEGEQGFANLAAASGCILPN